MTYGLPTSLEVCGTAYNIRSDFREILDIIGVLNDPDLNDGERAFLALLAFYPDFDTMPSEHHQEALRWCFWFINGGNDQDPDEPQQPVLMDWEKDYPYIVAPINRVIGHEVREDKHLHWWTFLSAYMEIGECTFAQIVHIRDLQRKGKPLDKADKEWYLKNHKLVDMKTKYSAEETELLKKWGGG